MSTLLLFFILLAVSETARKLTAFFVAAIFISAALGGAS